MWLRVIVGLLVLVPQLARPGEGRLVLLPFDGPVGATARGAVANAVMIALARRGHAVVAGEATERFLEERRIRYLDSLTGADVRALTETFQAEGVVLGAFLAVPDPREPGAALAARLVLPDGRTAWTATAGAPPDRPVPAAAVARPGPGDGADRGAGSVRQLQAAVDRLLETFPARGAAPPVARRAGWRATVPVTFRDPELLRGPRRVCLLPLANGTAAQGAARSVEAIFARALAERPEFVVVEPGELRRAFVQEGIFSPRWLTSDQYRRLAARVGGCMFLNGDILAYGEVPDLAAGATPAVEIYVSLYDPPTRRLVWSALHARRGQELEHVLGLGALRTRFEVAERVVDELVGALFAPAPPITQHGGSHR